MSGDVQLSSNDPARRAAERAALTTTTRLGLDAILAAAGWWAVLPGRRQGRSGFGEHGHWTSLLIALPVGFGIATAVELWHLLRGAA
ncbi:MAG: hypothetical protein ACJ8DJ_03490 [Gemmatimonadales bacterium]